jgi:hypothetical protein
MSNEKKLFPVLRAVHELLVQRQPAQHRLQTAHCPSLARFAAALAEGWTPQEREHMAGCAYCQKILAMEQSLSCERTHETPAQQDASSAALQPNPVER